MALRTLLPLTVLALSALAPLAAAGTTLVRTIDTSSAAPATAFKAFDADPPKVFDVNGDGKLEVIDQNDNRGVYVLDGGTGAILAQLTTWYPPGWGARPINGPEAAVVVRGGAPHLVVANSAAVVTDFVFDAANSTATRFAFREAWHRWNDDCYANPGMDAKPVLADLERKGQFDILVQTEETGVYALRPDGSLLWKKCINGGNAEPGVGDLNADGWLDAVWCNDSGTCTATRGTDGGTMWTYWVTGPFDLGSGSMPVAPTLAQLDGVGGDDVVVGARDSHNGTDFSQDHAALIALSSTGKLLWGFRAGNPLTYTHPIVADVDADGRPDVFWADWNTIGHKPPWDEAMSWNRTGPANFYRIDSTGHQVWHQALDTYWNNKDLVLADVTGDGKQDVVANGPGSGGDGLWYLDAATGAKEAFVGTNPWKVTRGPILADLWGSGTGQLVVPVYAATSAVSGGAIQVYDTHVPLRALSPHLPDPKLSSGAAPPPPAPPPPPSSGSFTATFRLGNVNDWWAEVYVTASSAVGSVSAQVNGGAWQSLDHQSWGAWARSIHVPGGSTVVFRATSASGATATSGAFPWPGSGGSGGSFTATFKLGNVNNWWAEVYVTGSEAVTGASAQVDGGSWVALGKQSWGAWAKSFHIPSGAHVVFRATGASGATATSSAFTWP